MNYHNITYPDQNNGDGLRVVLWTAGCSHHCPECQNPQTWNPNSGILFDENAKKEIFIELSKDYISGITLTGGDPLYESNLKDILLLLKEIKEKYPTKTVWLYTGYVYEWLLADYAYGVMTQYYNPDTNFHHDEFTRFEILTKCDVLVDGEYKKELRDITLKWRGSSNQRVIDVQKSLTEGKVVLFCD